MPVAQYNGREGRGAFLCWMGLAWPGKTCISLHVEVVGEAPFRAQLSRTNAGELALELAHLQLLILA
jgi:hypothetical protein